MTELTESTTYPTGAELVVDGYLSVWSEPDPDLRRRAITELWAPDGVEFVEGVQFRGHDELDARIAEAYKQFVESGRYSVMSANDVTGHHDVVIFTIQLIERGGEHAGKIAWAARVFLVVGPDGLIREDYQLTVQPLAS